MKKQVIIVEDDLETAQSLKEFFTGEPDFEVREVFHSAEAFLAETGEFNMPPELVLVDLGLPGKNGQELIAELCQEYSQVQCVAHTIFEDQSTVLSALRAGASGYLLKGLSKTQLLQSLRTLDQGGAPLTPKVARLLMTEFQGHDDNPLSSREQEVLGLLSRGHSYKECAQGLTVSVHTIHDHVKKIYRKLQVSNKRQAVKKATRKGWL